MATDIIARGMAASSVRPGSDGKIPAEYLPSYVDDVIDLLTISDTAPATCTEGDKYYNSTSKLIFTATGTNTWGTTGETPASGVIYINTAEDPSGSYRWDGLNLVLIGASGGQTIQYTEMPTAEAAIEGEIVQYIGATDSTYTNGYFYKCVENSGSYIWENIQVQTGSGGGVEGTHPVYTWDGDAISSSDTDKLAYIQKFFDDVVANKQPILLTNKSVTIGNINYKREVIINYRRYYNGQMSMEYAFLYDLNGGNNPAQMYNGTFTLYYDTNTMKVTSMGGIPDVFGGYHMLPASWCDNSSSLNNYNSASQYYLAPYNFRQYDVNTDWQPTHKKYVDDKIIWNVGGLLNYDGGEHSKIYFNAANVLGTSAPENPVESPYNGPAYTMEYTYASTQSITPSTKYLLHIVKILKTTYISSQNLTATISIIRNGTTLASKASSSVNIPYTTGTSDETTVSAEIVTNLGIEQNLEIQSGDIFRVVIASSQSGNYSSNGAIYSSDSESTYIEQYSGGMDANNVYDTINGVTYSQHEINQNINPTITTDSSTTDYTIASLIGNQTYKLGELTDLTITAVTTFDRESIIYFSSGSTPTDISIPDSLTNLGDVPTLTTASNVSTGTCEANKSYIIAVLNNIAVWKAY